MYELGSKGLLRWNAVQMITDPIIWNVSKRLGHREMLDKLAEDNSLYYNHYRTLKLAGYDISLVHPDWRG